MLLVPGTNKSDIRLFRKVILTWVAIVEKTKIMKNSEQKK
jgi:hypothetical protein